MKILVTGGHLTPALALIDYVKSVAPEHSFIFIGREYSQNKVKQKAQERTEVEKRQIPFIALATPRSSRSNVLIKFFSFFALIGAFVRSFFILLRHRPAIFVSFGGYVAVPVALAAWVLGIPIITHEQTRSAGYANLFISRLAQKVALTYPDNANGFPASKVVVTGNPLRAQLLAKSAITPKWFTATQKKPILFITGGNQGSFVINNTVAQALPRLVKNWVVIHACGNKTSTSNYLTELKKVQRTLPATVRDHYFIKEWVGVEDLSWILHNCQAVISRAGANTVQEIAAIRVPSLLIPLPFSHGDEQLLNARWLSDKGASILLPQKNLNPSTLVDATDQLLSKNKSMQRKLLEIQIPLNGSAQLYQVILDVIASRT